MTFRFLLLPQKTLLPCLRMGEVRPGAPSAASKKNSFDGDARESRGSRDGGRGGDAACAPNPLPRASSVRSKLRVGARRCRGGDSEPPVRKQ